MIFITGPLFSGKRYYAMELLGCGEEELGHRAALDVHQLAASCDDLPALVRELNRFEVVTAAELGGGVVPMDPHERDAREAAGRLAVLLAREARTVIRVFCGIPTILKGTLP